MTYDILVKRVNDNFRSGKRYHSMFVQKPNPEMHEINAWTYWQGLNVRHPRIMVVGQDWGSLYAGAPYFKAIDEMILNHDTLDKVHYFKYVPEMKKGSREFATDLNLIEYFTRLGNYDIENKLYSDLFFTNLIPGYRTEENSTGGFKSDWVTKQVKDDFKDLISVLRPQVVLCLGQDTFKQAALIYGKRGVMGGRKWNDYLDSNPEPLPINEESKVISYLFALPHPGYFGTMNRGKEKVKDDWDRVKAWLDEHTITSFSDES